MNNQISSLKNPMSVQAAQDQFGIPAACVAALAKNGQVSSDSFFPANSDKSVLLVERDEIKAYRMDGRNDDKSV